jgi:uncharacterized protein DUF5989
MTSLDDRTEGRSKEPPSKEFERIAAKERRRGGVSVFVQILMYLQESKRWWLLPVILALLIMGILIILGSTSAAPFIYTLF